MKDSRGAVIYVGKAKDLRARLSSYFAARARDVKTNALTSSCESFEVIVTNNELEAFVLECNLIKKYKPRYNILLKDDKKYPYIKVTLNEEYPALIVTRRVLKDKAKYFGPYYSAKTARDAIEAAAQIWPVRRCVKPITPKKNARVCLNYHIGKCPAPCACKISRDDYAKRVNEITLFLSGKFDAAAQALKKQMYALAASERFEEAAVLREAISAVNAIKQKQTAEFPNAYEFDAAALSQSGTTAVFFALFVRSGKIVGSARFSAQNLLNLSEADITAQFLERFYFGGANIPKEIVLYADIGEDNKTPLKAYLEHLSGGPVALSCRQTGLRAQIAKLAKKNASAELNRLVSPEKQNEKAKEALRQIKDALGLQTPPARIEAFDISNTYGALNVGSMVVFTDGEPKKSAYRKFKIKNTQGANDPACMFEVIERRFARQNAPNPDLIFVDGGGAQIAAAQKALHACGANVPVCGMVKDDKHKTRGLLFNGEEINPPKTGAGFLLTEAIQNEAHRFAVTYHRRLTQKRLVLSELENIKGVGPKKRAALFARFGSVAAVKEADISALAETDSITKTDAKAIFEYFHEA